MRYWNWYDPALHLAGHTVVHLIAGVWTLLSRELRGIL
jgi:hypothetical protein